MSTIIYNGTLLISCGCCDFGPGGWVTPEEPLGKLYARLEEIKGNDDCITLTGTEATRLEKEVAQ